MAKKKDGLPYQEAAELRVIEAPQWFCKTCNRFWGKDEHMARYCCSVSQPCEGCGKQIPSRSYIKCDSCMAADDEKKWDAKPELAWDGTFPIALWDSDNYFFDVEQLRDWLFDRDLEDSISEDDSYSLKGLRLTNCERQKPRQFSIADLLEEYGDGDQDPPENRELEKQVNDWVLENAGEMWQMIGKRLRLSEIQDAVNASINQ